MTLRGHGAPGLVDNLRTFADLVEDSGASRRPYLEYFPGSELTTGWALAGGAYQYNGLLNQTFSGVLLDIVGVDTSLGSLTRVESKAECDAGAGTYYAAAMFGAASPVPSWDDGTIWDTAGVTWDHVTFVDLYVHLAGDANPNSATVVPLVGLFFGVRGEVHPQLGPEKLTNGGFESLAGWNENVTPGWDDGATLWDGPTSWDSTPITSAQDTTLFYGRGSTASLKLVSTGAVPGQDSRYRDVATIAGALYLLPLYYRTDPAFSANLSARLLIGNTTGTTTLYADGRDGDASGFAALTPTGGEWRRGFFTFIAPASTTRLRLQLVAAVAGAGQINFDGVGLKRIHRFVYYEPRLSADSIPEVEVGSQSIFFAGKTDGQGAFSMINADGALEALLPDLLLHGKPATVYVGGHFLSDGREVYRDDWRGAWPGRAQKVTATDGLVSFESDDARDALHVDLPTRKHSLAVEAGLNLSEEGSGRAIIFGEQVDPTFPPYATTTVFPPARVDLTANGYGVYEVGDAGASLAGLPDAIVDFVGSSFGRQFPNFKIYPSEDLATKEQLGVNFLALEQFFGGFFGGSWYPGGPAIGTFFTYDKTTGRITVVDDIRNYWQNRDGTDVGDVLLFDFSIGVGPLVAGVTGQGGSVGGIRYYLSANMLAGALQERMRTAAGVADIFVDYSHTTHLWTVRRTAGTLSLLPASGGNAKSAAWNRVGFDVTGDKTGALSYTGTTPTFTSPEADHIVRVSSHGFVDDSLGTITGTPGALISRHAHVAKYVLYQYLRIPASQIDAASFAAGAAAEPAGLVCVTLREQTSSRDFLSRLEAGALADLVIDGEGIWYWKAYSATAPVVQDFFDRDYIDFEIVKDPKNIFSSARTTYGQNLNRGSDKAYESVADSGIPTKHRRIEVRAIDTYIGGDVAADAAAQLVTQRTARLAAANPAVVSFSARGKLAYVLQGDIIRLTRTRAFYPGGAMTAVRFRVLAMRHNLLAGVSTCTAVEDVQFLS